MYSVCIRVCNPLVAPPSSRISLKREAAVSKEVLGELNNSATGKKLSKAEKDER